jgi:hypothetical protein
MGKSKPNSNFDFKYSVKNVKIDDYLTDRRLNFPIQIKEHIYNKFYKETKMSKGGELTNEQKIEKLLKKRYDLDSKLLDARVKENERFNTLGWGSGMRLSKINISTRRSDGLKERIKEVEKELKELGYKKKYAKGGKVKSTFDEKVKAISKRLFGQKVPKKYKKEYGATYDKAEAKQAGRRIAGSQLVKLKEKMEKMRKAKKKS